MVKKDKDLLLKGITPKVRNFSPNSILLLMREKMMRNIMKKLLKRVKSIKLVSCASIRMSLPRNWKPFLITTISGQKFHQHA